jgi:hypothetical protein
MHEDDGEEPSELLARFGPAGMGKLETLLQHGLPADSVLILGRWWQLETYLRQLVYIQLKGLLGPGWDEPIVSARKRWEASAEWGYMESPDDGLLMSYLDVSPLFDLIDEYWEQCSMGLGVPQNVWHGRIEELKPVRHRLAHCRRPHRDDLGRVEQLLRDIDPAARRLLGAYVDWLDPAPDLEDPVVAAWVHCEHPVAMRLVQHGHRIKGIHFELKTSALPWADRRAPMITGSAGWFWVMHAVLDERTVTIDDYLEAGAVRSLLNVAGHVVQASPWQLAVTIPAVGDPDTIADEIGRFLEPVFSASRGRDSDDVRRSWNRLTLDMRCDAKGLLSVLSGLYADDPITIFSAG